MNFLLHRHFATRETGSDALGFGAMLPDLARLADRRWRAPTSLEDVVGSPVLSALHRGIRHHIEADAWFHRTQVFREGEKRTTAALRATMGAPAAAAIPGATRATGFSPRLGLFGHVTWEMCLDGAWLRRGGDVSARIVELQGDVRRFGAEASVALRGAAAGSDAHLASRIDALWPRLADLAAGYADGDGVARRLDGIRRSLGLPAAPDDVRRHWGKALDACLADAEASLPALELEREAHRARCAAAGAATGL